MEFLALIGVVGMGIGISMMKRGEKVRRSDRSDSSDFGISVIVFLKAVAIVVLVYFGVPLLLAALPAILVVGVIVFLVKSSISGDR